VLSPRATAGAGHIRLLFAGCRLRRNSSDIIVEIAVAAGVTDSGIAQRDGETDLESLMRQHHPDIIVYDVALPYEPNWRLLQHIRSTSACEGVPFVLTSTNAAQVRNVAATEEMIVEIVGKPYDLEQLVDSVQRAVTSRRR
jgi:CheY-like chemotaxis protein